jgi:hypothetical protein
VIADARVERFVRRAAELTQPASGNGDAAALAPDGGGGGASGGSPDAPRGVAALRARFERTPREGAGAGRVSLRQDGAFGKTAGAAVDLDNATARAMSRATFLGCLALRALEPKGGSEEAMAACQGVSVAMLRARAESGGSRGGRAQSHASSAARADVGSERGALPSLLATDEVDQAAIRLDALAWAEANPGAMTDAIFLRRMSASRRQVTVGQRRSVNPIIEVSAAALVAASA